MTLLGSAFLAAARARFAALAHGFDLHEVGAEDTLNFAALTLKGASHYVRIRCDFRDRFVDASIGMVTEGVVPPIPLAPPRTAEQVREIPSGVMLWAASGDRAEPFGIGEYPDETPAEVEATVTRLAEALTPHLGSIFSGDDSRWRELAELSVSRYRSP